MMEGGWIVRVYNKNFFPNVSNRDTLYGVEKIDRDEKTIRGWCNNFLREKSNGA